MFWLVPNFGAVNANTQLPPTSTREKFPLAAHDSVVDYSSYTWTGILAGQAMLLNSDPELGHGNAAMVAIIGVTSWMASRGHFSPKPLSPRSHTRIHGITPWREGGFFHRTGYAIFRGFVTRTDSGGTSFNWSEVAGNGLEAALSNAYYPPQERGLNQTAVNWGTQMESAVLNHVFQEFWPDIRRNVFRQK